MTSQLLESNLSLDPDDYADLIVTNNGGEQDEIGVGEGTESHDDIILDGTQGGISEYIRTHTRDNTLIFERMYLSSEFLLELHTVLEYDANVRRYYLNKINGIEFWNCTFPTSIDGTQSQSQSISQSQSQSQSQSESPSKKGKANSNNNNSININNHSHSHNHNNNNMNNIDDSCELLCAILMIISEIIRKHGNEFEKLQFSLCNMDDCHFQYLNDSLVYLSDSLKQLRINHNEISYESLFNLESLFQDESSYLHKNLKVLDLSGNSSLFNNKHKMALKSVASKPGTDNSCNINNNKHNNHNYSNINDNNRMGELSDINLIFESFVENGLINSHIEELYLSNLDLTWIHLKILKKYLTHNNCRVKILDISLNKTHDNINLPFMKQLCEILSDKNCFIEKLLFSQANYGEKIDYGNGEAFGYFSRNIKNIYHSSLWYLDISGIDPMSWMKFCSDKTCLSSICYLNICNTRLRSHYDYYKLGFGCVSDSLCTMIANKFPHLQFLNLKKCDLSNDDICDMGAFLSDHYCLRQINLTNNLLTNAVVDRLLNCVKNSRKCSAKMVEKIANAICQSAGKMFKNNKMDEIIEQKENYLETSKETQMNQENTENKENKENKEDINDDNDSKHLGAFPLEVSFLIIEYLQDDPGVGIKSLLLQGNSILSKYSAAFRQTHLLDTLKMRQISLQKIKRNADSTSSLKYLG